MTENKWYKTICPVCGEEFEYIEDYKPKTCNKYDCIHKYLHPELVTSKHNNRKERKDNG